MKITTINLAEICQEKISILAGKERGEAIREKYHLDDIDTDASAKALIIIPVYLDTIASSFFNGAFSKSIIKCGNRDAFLSKFSFQCDDFQRKQIVKNIDVVFSIFSSIHGKDQ